MKNTIKITNNAFDLLQELVNVSRDNLGCLSLSEQMRDEDEEFMTEGQRQDAMTELFQIVEGYNATK